MGWLVDIVYPVSQPSVLICHEMGTSPIRRTYANAHIDPRTPSPPLEPAPVLNTLLLEPEPRVCHEMGTSPFRKGYTDVTTNPRTPSPLRLPPSVTRSTRGMYFFPSSIRMSIIFALVAISPTPDANHYLSISTSRRYSDSPTLGMHGNPYLIDHLPSFIFSFFQWAIPATPRSSQAPTSRKR